jgi:hypothetical protein
MKKSIYWIIAVVITLVLSVYQRMTGPTYPKSLTVEVNGEQYKVKLPRSGVQRDEVVTLKGVPQGMSSRPPHLSSRLSEAHGEISGDPSTTLGMTMHYRRYPSGDDYTTVDFSWKDGAWQAALPMQPVAGKLQYYITVDGKDYLADEPIVIRFRNDVPAIILIPHIILMFAAMLFAVYTFLLVVTRKSYKRWLKITVATLFVGGFILGPLVQHAAFGPWWAGFPYGTDLTDNKTLIAFLFFMAALATMKWKYNKWVVCLAVLMMIAVFTIPHSAYGSEYDYNTQQLGTAK